MKKTLTSSHLHQILLVDDEEIVLKPTKQYLETCYPFNVDIALSGEEALEKISAGHYNAIITDFEMKGMSGLVLLKTVREGGNDIPFIIFTGKGREDVVIAAYDNGADGYVQKGGEITSQFAELAHRIQTAIEKKHSLRALQESEEKFRQLFHNASDAIYLHEFGGNKGPGKFLEVNTAACNMMGYTYDELLNLEVSELNTPQSNQIIPEVSRQLSEKKHITFECTHRTKDGIEIPVEVSSHFFSLNNKQVVLSICRNITERRQAEKEKNATLTGLKDIIVEYVDRDMKIIWANQAMRDAFGITGEISGDTCYRITQQRDSPCPGCTAQKAISTGKFQEGEVATPDGRYWMVRSNPVFEHGEVTSVVHVAIDITERRRAEEELSRSKQEMADIIDFLPDATFVVDKNGLVIAWNKAMEKLTGIQASDMIGKGDYEYAIPFYGIRRPILIDLALRYDPDIASSYSDIQKDGEKIISESIISNFHGTDVTLWCIASPLFDQSGWFIGAIESIRDVTERKQTETALRETLSTLQTVMDNVDATVYVSDMQTYEVLFANQYVKNICGDIIGKKCYETMQKDQTEPCSFCTNHQLLDPDGNPRGPVIWDFLNTVTKRWYHCHDNAMKWIDGRMVRLEIASDISEQKKAENALVASNRQLSMLTGITRHDIRNTINAMDIFIELIKNKLDISAAYKEFENLERTISQIQSQIEFTRVYQELGSHNPQWQQVYRLIAQISQQYSINLYNNAGNFEIYADPLLIKVFENLIENSIRHGETVTSIAISTTSENHEISLIFEDDGIGIPVSDKELIFERGFGKNTGMGLFFIREILGITGMTITETGQEGQGVRFEICIPEGIWRTLS